MLIARGMLNGVAVLLTASLTVACGDAPAIPHAVASKQDTSCANCHKPHHSGCVNCHGENP